MCSCLRAWTPLIDNGMLNMLTSQSLILQCMWQEADFKKWPIKTQNVKLSLNRLSALCKKCASTPFTQAHGTLFHSSITRSRGEGRALIHAAWKGSTGGPELISPPQNTIKLDLLLHSRRKEDMKDNHKLSNVPLWNFHFRPFSVPSYFLSQEDELPPSIICFYLPVSLRLRQGSGQPCCVTDSKVIHDLAEEATPSVLYLFSSMYVYLRQKEKLAWSVCSCH